MSTAVDEARLIALANEGLSVRRISAELGVHWTTTRRCMHRLIAEGRMARAAERRGTDPNALTHMRLLRLYGRPLGRLTDMLQEIPAEHTHWLMRQIPEGGKLTDMLGALIADAYAEDTE